MSEFKPSGLSTGERLQRERNANITDCQRARWQRSEQSLSPISIMSLSTAWRRLCISERIDADGDSEFSWARYLQELTGIRGMAS